MPVAVLRTLGAIMRLLICSILFATTFLAAAGSAIRGAVGQTAPAPLGTAPADAPVPSELVHAYVEMGLPVPPATARLIVFEPGNTVIVNGKVVHNRSLALMLEPPTVKRGPIVLAGAEEMELHGGTITPVRADLLNLDASATPLRSASFDTEDRMLLLSIQCEILGQHEPARKLYKAAVPAGTPALAQLAWNHQLNELLVPGSDRTAICARLVKLQSSLAEPDTALVRDLAQTIAPPPPLAKPALPLEDQVNALTEYSAERGWFRAGAGSDSAYSALRHDCIRAVPALIAHLTDRRLTRVFSPAFMMRQPAILRVQDIVSELLEETLEPQRAQGDDHRLELLTALQKEVADQGEEKFLRSHILLKGNVNRLFLDTLVAKYPRDLITVYEQAVAEKRSDDARTICEELAVADLPADLRAKTFLAAEPNADLGVKLSALWGLFHLHHPEFDPRLAAAIDRLPPTSTGPYWKSRESEFGILVIRSTDPEVWRAYARWADRADVGQRLELLNFMDYQGAIKENLPQRIAFCRHFLDDQAVRKISDDPAKYDGPCAGFGYESLRVADQAALELAALLDIDDQLPQRISEAVTVSPGNTARPEPGSPATQWQDLHDLVIAKLKQYDAATPKNH